MDSWRIALYFMGNAHHLLISTFQCSFWKPLFFFIADWSNDPYFKQQYWWWEVSCEGIGSMCISFILHCQFLFAKYQVVQNIKEGRREHILPIARLFQLGQLRLLRLRKNSLAGGSPLVQWCFGPLSWYSSPWDSFYSWLSQPTLTKTRTLQSNSTGSPLTCQPASQAGRKVPGYICQVPGPG